MLNHGEQMLYQQLHQIYLKIKLCRFFFLLEIKNEIYFRFEAADPKVFAYHIQNSGAHANLFIDHSQIVQLACLRKGIWGTDKTFGRIVTFQN
jgi:phosphosulfolactate synthase (CoM biosynthesis protein A)